MTDAAWKSSAAVTPGNTLSISHNITVISMLNGLEV